MTQLIYMDNAGTTRPDPAVVKTLTEAMATDWGNASTTNAYGRRAKQSLEESRQLFASSINAQFEDEVVLTSGGTEGDNTVIKQVARARAKEGRHIITTAVEHEAVLRPLQDLEGEGFEVTYLPVNEAGQISLADLKAALRPDTILVSVMTVNNEVGAVMPIHAIGELVAESHAWFHTDAVQAYGTLPLDVQRDRIDFLTVSAHKLNGPKQIGFLYRRRGRNLPALIRGGDQELKRRAGTEDVPGTLAFATAVRLHQEHQAANRAHYRALKQRLVAGLTAAGIDFAVNGGAEEHQAPQVLSVWFKGVPNDALLTNLDLAGIVAAAGSACTSGSLDPSHVLVAMYGEASPRVWETLRFSFGVNNTEEEVDRVVAALAKFVPRLKDRGDRGQR